jgi:hypothetical protein
MAVIVLAARSFLIEQGASDSVRLVALVALGIVVYLPLLAWRAPEVLAELRDLRNRREAVPVAAPVVTET